MNAAANHLLGLINDVLDFSKLESAKLELHDEVFELAELMAYVRDIVEQRVEGKAVDITVIIDAEIPALLLGDRLRLAQVLSNFASNAGKFTERGAITLRVKQTDSNLFDYTRVPLRFEIEDSGIGLTVDQQKKLFQPFVQADASITRLYGGTGLGLALSRSIATAMGGTVGVESEPGSGSTFWLEVSLGCNVLSSLPPANTVASGYIRQLIGTVLLVEDNSINQEVAREILEDMGLVVDVADDGLHALERCRDKRYDVILMDMQMPRMDGLTATRMLRENISFAATPILAMTANSTLNDRKECLAAGMNDFITKPIMPELLEMKLAEYLTEKLPPMPENIKAESTATVMPASEPVVQLSALQISALGRLASRLVNFPGVDLVQSLKSCAGKPELLERALQLFVTQHGDAGERLSALLAIGEWKDAERLAHTLKGSGASLGAVDLSSAALHVESAIKLNVSTRRTDVIPMDALVASLLELTRAIEGTTSALVSGPAYHE